MRRAVLSIFILTGLLSAIIVYGPTVSLVHDASAAPGEIPPGLADDIYYVLNFENSELAVSFSHTEHFYDDTICISIEANNPDAVIYYTTDGNTPTDESNIFTQPIILTAADEVNCTVLKAIAIDDGEQSAVLTHSYFVGKTVHERFQTQYIFSISSDEDGLYGYENGILVPGKIYDDYMAKNPDTDTASWHRPANYNRRGRDWERSVYIEAFSNNGKQLVDQNAGMRIYGGATRYFPQKSLRVIARKEYEPNAGKFSNIFFDGYYNRETFAKPILSFDTIILRNDGNDWTRARLRNTLALQVAHEIGYPAVTPQAASAVFINGEYYGYACLNVLINEQFLQDLYGTSDRAFDIVVGGLRGVSTENDTIQAEFNSFFEILTQDIDTTSKIDIINTNFDIDNLLLYYAIEAYLGNTDWGGNGNVKIWRYKGTQPTATNAELDGRWRYILFDLDQTMGYNENSNPSASMLNRILNDSHPIFKYLAEQPAYIEIFTNLICDLAFEHFSISNAGRVIDEINKFTLCELEQSAIRWNRDIDVLLERREAIIEFLTQRPDYVLTELQEAFNFTDFYTIVSDGSCKINTLNGNVGIYFVENNVPVVPVLANGQVFEYWLVNGEKREGIDLIISVNDANTERLVNISPVIRYESPPLLFDNTYDTGSLSGFTMYNPYNTVQNTRGLYLSNDIENLHKWAFPDMNIRPHSVWEFVGRNSISSDALLKIGLNFNPRYGEVVFLTNEERTILDYITVMP